MSICPTIYTYKTRHVTPHRFSVSTHTANGPWQLSRYNVSLPTGRSVDRIPAEVRFSALGQTGPGIHPVSCTMGTSFPATRAWRCTPTLSSAEVKERVWSYLYTPSWPSWPVLGWTLFSPIQQTTRRHVPQDHNLKTIAERISYLVVHW